MHRHNVNERGEKRGEKRGEERKKEHETSEERTSRIRTDEKCEGRESESREDKIMHREVN